MCWHGNFECSSATKFLLLLVFRLYLRMLPAVPLHVPTRLHILAAGVSGCSWCRRLYKELPYVAEVVGVSYSKGKEVVKIQQARLR